MVTFTTPALNPRGNSSPVPTEPEAEWVPKPVWTLGKKKNQTATIQPVDRRNVD
jgi:hypothetical protein